MTVEQFIESNINNARGAYTPADVAKLVRDAWREGRLEAQQDVIKMVEKQ